MPELTEHRFRDTKIGDIFYLPSDVEPIQTMSGKVIYRLKPDNSEGFIRIDMPMKAVELRTGFTWDFRNDYTVFFG